MIAPAAPYHPDLDSIDPSLDLREEIQRLRSQRNAVILAHYYQEPEIQDLADFVGDSLQLSQQAAATRAITARHRRAERGRGRGDTMAAS